MSALRAVLVGAGPMGRAWAETIRGHPDVRLVCWVDLVVDRVVQGVQELRLGDVAADDDLLAALDRHAPDFVVDVSVPWAHHEVTAACLDRRVAVLGEKPMAATLEEARDLVERSERSVTLFVVSQNRRYNQGLVAFRGLLAEELGELGQLNVEFYRAPHFGGFRDEMDSPLLVDMAIHAFDAARYLSGSDPLSVSCSELNPPWSWYRGAASAVADFELDNGAHFSYQGSWCAAGHETSWDGSWRAVGARGSALWDGTTDPVAELLPGDDGSTRTVRAGPASIPGPGIAGSLADFVDALRNDRTPMGECHDNIKSLAMVSAALESSRTGSRVRLDSGR